MEDKDHTQKLLSSFSEEFDKGLIELIPSAKNTSKHLHKAMIYVIEVGGKRLRPIFLTEISKLLGVKSEHAFRAAASVEFIHCYSLVHDDLPAMDNDDLRRGNPTCHKMFDEATAVLVGDAFQTLAFQILADEKTHCDPNKRIMLINELAKSSGSEGMVGGQMLDLEAEKKKLNLKQIYNLQRLKTGELFRFSCVSPCILAGKKVEIRLFEEFSYNLGLAFQIKDDLLDVEGNEKEIGKKTQKDSSLGKETLISLLGKENAKKKSKELIDESLKILKKFGKKAENLINLTEFIISRSK
ncbi:MAG: farnesyl-diphosphate synthase [Rickettsiales bacterium]|nr:farnesyl-diphosphate synthase [Rickettsiales bacterium]|tara:strand:- start:1146 stop:2039 length:894 start_codon:yes stop_codon:yes gene_type:complete